MVFVLVVLWELKAVLMAVMKAHE
jgi:hypothetical protein